MSTPITRMSSLREIAEGISAPIKQERMAVEEIRKTSRKPRPSFKCNGAVEYFYSSGVLTITIPALPPSKNTYVRAHWRSQQSKYFKPWEKMMEGTYIEREGFREAVEVEIRLHFPDKRSRDVLNLVCFPPLMDCLKSEGIIPDDNCKVCKIVIAEPIMDKTSQTVIRIKRLNGGTR